MGFVFTSAIIGMLGMVCVLNANQHMLMCFNLLWKARQSLSYDLSID
jgi:hypothetical protein